MLKTVLAAINCLFYILKCSKLLFFSRIYITLKVFHKGYIEEIYYCESLIRYL